jgi:hypothetical protein
MGNICRCQGRQMTPWEKIPIAQFQDSFTVIQIEYFS